MGKVLGLDLCGGFNMGVLDSVLRYKEAQQARQDALTNELPNSIANATNTFLAAKQQAQDNQFKMLAIRTQLANSGLSLNPDGSISRDESLKSPLDKLIEQSKAAEAAKVMGDRGLWASLTNQNIPGQPSQPVAQSGSTQQPNQLLGSGPMNPVGNQLASMKAPEIDPFTGKPTTEGVRQEAINKQIEAQGLEMAKTEAKNAEKAKGMQAIEGDLNSVLKLYNEIPGGLKGPIEGRTLGTLAKLTGFNASLNTYEDARGLVLANISREFGGEKGVLTDRDIKRIEDAFPKREDTNEIATKKIEFIRDFVKRKIDVKSPNAPLSGQTKSGLKYVVNQ